MTNFAILVWKMNLVKNQEFIGQLVENEPINSEVNIRANLVGILLTLKNRRGEH